jgi:pilus assembly protein Flp/PilA
MTTFIVLRTWLQRRCTTDRGASLVEYALLVSLIAVVCLLAVAGIGSDVNERFQTLTDNLNT